MLGSPSFRTAAEAATLMTTTERQLALLQFQADLDGHLERVREVDKALWVALRTCHDFFGSDESCLAVATPGERAAHVRYMIPQEVDWDADLLGDLIRGERPRLGHNVLFMPIERRERSWGVLVMRRVAGEFERLARRDVVRIGDVFSRRIASMDRLRTSEVRARIDRKILEQLRPQDLFYQLLHGLRSLTRYDHSSALLTYEQGPGALELVAEQITWRKGRSQRIGRTVQLSDEVQSLLEADEVFGFDRKDERWVEWDGRAVDALAEALDLGADAGDDGETRREGSMLVAPLSTREGALGVLKVAANHPGRLGRYELELVRRFVPQAAMAVQNLARTASLEKGMLAAEKKHVMANLARGVSHDINNALGSVLPLVQQMRVDVREDEGDPDVLARDLRQVERSLQVCRRIFGGMLAIARGATHGVPEGDVFRAVAATLAVLEESMRRSTIRVVVDLPEQLPRVRVGQGDLEQLVLNLATNARDAMPEGGELRIEASAADGHVELVIGDTGNGITASHLARVQEPFFTTKRHGNGLGLSICRSIVWSCKGQLSIESDVGSGTRVRVTLPRAEEATS